MRVCFVSHTSGWGGAERALVELIEALKKRGVDCYVLLPRGGDLVRELRERHIPFRMFPYRMWVGRNSPLWKRVGRAMLTLATVVPVANAMMRWRCDIVVTNTFTVCVGALAAKLVGRPHVWYVHDFIYEHHGFTFDLGSRFSFWLMRRSLYWVFNSHAVAAKFREYLGPSDLRVVYQSVGFAPEPRLGDGAIRLRDGTRMRCVIVGVLHEAKGQQEAIRAIAHLARTGVPVELLVIGRGDPKYLSVLLGLVAENQVHRHVEFVGYVENPIPFMESADAVLMCSRFEGFGRVTVEAMRAGKPVIGARSGGTVELIRDGFNGLLYTPGSHTELAERIRYLYEQPSLAARMGQNGRRWASVQFTEKRYAEGVLDVLNACLARSGRRGNAGRSLSMASKQAVQGSEARAEQH